MMASASSNGDAHHRGNSPVARLLKKSAIREPKRACEMEGVEGVEGEKVLLLYTGGTIGMKANEEGALHPVKGFLEEKINQLEELKRPGMPSCSVLEFDPLIDSSDITPQDWKYLAEIIEKNYYEFDGFVIIHGTDTMSYSASALSFMLENLAKPVIFTGSQLPFGEVHTDARRNLIVSIMLAAHADIPEVCVFFNDVLLRGNRSLKLDSMSVDAFHSPNFPPLGKLGVDMKLKENLFLPPARGRFQVHTQLDCHVLVVRLVPGFVDFDILGSNKSVKGVVLMLYGTGNAPSRKQDFVAWVEKLIERGVVVVGVSQCLKGHAAVGKYAVGAQLEKAGVLSARDMTCEAAVTKLAYLLGRGLSLQQIAAAFEMPLRGELTEVERDVHLFRKAGGLHVKL